MSEKELWELISIISEGQDSEQRRKVEQYITDLQKEIDMYKTSFETMSTNYFRLENIIKEVREKVDNFDVFKEFTFPLMKRDEEQQVKSSIDYEWRKSIKEPILEILDKENI